MQTLVYNNRVIIIKIYGTHQLQLKRNTRGTRVSHARATRTIHEYFYQHTRNRIYLRVQAHTRNRHLLTRKAHFSTHTRIQVSRRVA